MARYCCQHHPKYKYRSAPEKDNVETVQEVVARAQVVNVESQVTTEGIGDFDIGQSDDRDKEDPVGGVDLDAVALNERYFSGDDGGVDIEDREDDYGITDYTAGQFDIHNRVRHIMRGVPISLQNRVAVEAAYMVEAVTTVRCMRSMRKTEIAPLVHDRYKSFIRVIPLERFADATVRVKMVEKSRGGFHDEI